MTSTLDPEDIFVEVPASIGFGLMQSIRAKDFVTRKDFNKVWDRAVDCASADPNAGNYVP